MTNTVHGGQPPETAAVKPVVFSHEAVDEPVPRPAAGERAHHIDFSAHTPANSRTNP